MYTFKKNKLTLTYVYLFTLGLVLSVQGYSTIDPQTAVAVWPFDGKGIRQNTWTVTCFSPQKINLNLGQSKNHVRIFR